MSILAALLDFLTQNNSAPSGDEREVVLGEVLTPPCRAFYVDNGPVAISYVQANGNVVSGKIVEGRIYHPVKVEQFTTLGQVAGQPAGTPVRIFAQF